MTVRPSQFSSINSDASDSEAARVMVQDTVGWLERAVIGLNLCPFAKAVHVKGQVHCVVSAAQNLNELREDLLKELKERMNLLKNKYQNYLIRFRLSK